MQKPANIEKLSNSQRRKLKKLKKLKELQRFTDQRYRDWADFIRIGFRIAYFDFLGFKESLKPVKKIYIRHILRFYKVAFTVNNEYITEDFLEAADNFVFFANYITKMKKFELDFMTSRRQLRFIRLKNRIKKFFVKKKHNRVRIFKNLLKQKFFRFFNLVLRKKFKKLIKINIFDIYFIFRKRLIKFYKKNKYILKIKKKLNNLYITLVTGTGHVVLSYSAGQVFRLNFKELQEPQPSFKRVVFNYSIPKKHRSKNKKQQQKVKVVEKEIKVQNRLRNKKRRRSINVLKQILPVFIKKLIILRILRIDFFEAKGNSKRVIMLVLKSFLKYGIQVENYINFKARPHNNHKNIKYKKSKRK